MAARASLLLASTLIASCATPAAGPPAPHPIAAPRPVQRSCGDRGGCRMVMRDGFMSENTLSAELGGGYYAVALEFSEGGYTFPPERPQPTAR